MPHAVTTAGALLLRLVLAALVASCLALGAACATQPGQQEPHAADATAGSPDTAPVTIMAGMEFVLVPGGCFVMGKIAPQGQQGRGEEVCVDAFWISRYEVTQRQWRAVVQRGVVDLPEPAPLPAGAEGLVVDPEDPSLVKGDDLPVDRVSWNMARAFAKGLSDLTGRSFRLPTEAEWEYACRSGGLAQEFCGSAPLDAIAWYRGNSGRRPHPVGAKSPNGLGLYDMSGNVWEWCSDVYIADIAEEVPAAGQGRAPRVLRGGGYNTEAAGLRSIFRGHVSPAVMDMGLGLRLVLDGPGVE